MIALMISLVLIVFVGLLGKYTSFMTQAQTKFLGKYTSFMTQAQTKFLLVSAVLYIILFGVVMSMLTSDRGILEVFMDNSIYIPLIFYIVWYLTSASLTNVLTGRNDYQGFFEDTNPYMSRRNLMPR